MLRMTRSEEENTQIMFDSICKSGGERRRSLSESCRCVHDKVRFITQDVLYRNNERILNRTRSIVRKKKNAIIVPGMSACTPSLRMMTTMNAAAQTAHSATRPIQLYRSSVLTICHMPPSLHDLHGDLIDGHPAFVYVLCTDFFQMPHRGLPIRRDHLVIAS